MIWGHLGFRAVLAHPWAQGPGGEVGSQTLKPVGQTVSFVKYMYLAWLGFHRGEWGSQTLKPEVYLLNFDRLTILQEGCAFREAAGVPDCTSQSTGWAWPQDRAGRSATLEQDPMGALGPQGAKVTRGTLAQGPEGPYNTLQK